MRSRLIISAIAIVVIGSVLWSYRSDEGQDAAAWRVGQAQNGRADTAFSASARGSDAGRDPSGDAGSPDAADSAASAAGEIDPWREVLDAVKVRQSEPPPMAVAPYGPAFERLMKAFRAGNGEVSPALLTILELCDSAYRSRAELEEAIDDAYDARVLRLPGQSLQEAQRLSEDENLSHVDEGLVKHHEQCVDVPRVDAATKHELQRAAAEAGYADVAIHHGWKNLEVGDREGAAWLFEQAWYEGSWHALAALADVISDWPSSEPPVQVLQGTLDSALAPDASEYALRLAYNKLQDAMITSNSQIVARKKEMDARRLRELGTRLLPHEIEQATEVAMDIVRQNSNCCIRF